jgi:hypothetical protein
MAADAGAGTVDGPICPDCRRPLRETLRNETVPAVGAPESRFTPISVTFCGSCGWTLAATQGPPTPMPGFGMTSPPEVVDPEDPSTLEGKFQLRCRELVNETMTAGFLPGGWIGQINSKGAVGAAQHLLSTGRVLPVTRWLVEQGRPELTMEHEVTEPRWEDLFTDEDRAEAARRLKRGSRQAGPEPTC